jgi:hypothetical protein
MWSNKKLKRKKYYEEMHTKALVNIIKKSTCGPAYLPIKKGSQTSFFLFFFFYVKGLKTCHPPLFFFYFFKVFYFVRWYIIYILRFWLD